jgi:AcrR family transcriptional regulator
MLIPVSGQPGLRERKKQRTRKAIARAAHELFVERGYSTTTLPEIAEAADVSTRTIFAYFPSKEDILFDDLEQMKGALAQVLADRPEGKDALETVREFILSSQRADMSELDQELHLCISSDPTLRNHLRARIAQFEEVIAPAIAQDLETSEDDPRTQLVTASLTAAFNLLADRGATKTRPWTPKELAGQIDPVFTFLRAGLQALKNPSTKRRRRVVDRVAQTI